MNETTRLAFQHPTKPSASQDRFKTLLKLKGVGPATASLILSLLDPQEEAFMSDESWQCVEALKDRKLNYTDKDWILWREEMRKRKDKEGWESMAALEKACWAYVQGKDDPQPPAKRQKRSLATQQDSETAPTTKRPNRTSTRTRHGSGRDGSR